MSFPQNIHRIGLSIQNTKGTPAATPSAAAYTTAGTIIPIREVADFEETTENRLRVGQYIARQRAGGAPSFYARPILAGYLLYGVMGAKTTTGAGPYIHTFTLAASQPWFTFWRSLGGVDFERFVDCKINSLTLTSAEGGVLTMAADVQGIAAQFLTADALGAMTAEATHPFVHYDSAGALMVENTAIAHISNVTITIAAGVTAVPGNTPWPYTIAEGMLDITITTDQLVTDRLLWNRLHYGSATPTNAAPQTGTPLTLGGSPAGIDFTWTRGAASLKVAATNVLVSEIGGMEPGTGNDPLRQQVTYKVYKPATGSGLTAILTNTQATYVGS